MDLFEKNIVSKLDGKTYNRQNGHFTRHLRANGLTYQQYYEKYITGVEEKCPYCGKPKSFQQKDHSYAKTCGDKMCYGLLMREIKADFDDEKTQRINEKRRITNISRYGVVSVSQMDEIKQKVRNNRSTIMNDGRTKEEHLQEKAKLAKLVKYGDEHYNNAAQISRTKKARTVEQNNLTNEKRRQTNLSRYGVETPLLKDGVIKKSAAGNALHKPYTLPSGKIIEVLGHEGKALDVLLKRYREDDLVIHETKNSSSFPKELILEYVNSADNIKHYYPDIYVKSENRIIEVKSPWWWDGDGKEKYRTRLENNLRKADAAIAAGYRYEIWVLYEDGWKTFTEMDLAKLPRIGKKK